MVGTAYLSPEPGKPAFVAVGSKVSRRPDHPHHRGDEDDEPDPGAPLGHGHAHPRRGRHARSNTASRSRSSSNVPKVLIANRGEIALRVLRACKELGISTVAVYSTADRNAMHVRMADESVCIGPPPARDSYLNIPSILAACEITGADAVHPGYGFLSENARFARILTEHKITFIGPSEHHIQIMGDKITAKQTAVELGIPVVPGSKGEVAHRGRGQETAAKKIGYPVLDQGHRRRRRARHEGRALPRPTC